MKQRKTYNERGRERTREGKKNKEGWRKTVRKRESGERETEKERKKGERERNK